MKIPRNDMRQAMHEYTKPQCKEGQAMGAVPYACRQDKAGCKCAKKVVHYTPSENDFIQVGHGAFIKPVDHPDSERVSNVKYVITSQVVAYDRDTDEFETLNTLYRPVK